MYTSQKGIITDKLYSFIFANWRTTSQVSLLMLMLLFLAPTAQADHLAGAKMTWVSTGNDREVRFSIRLSLRREEYRINDTLPQVGQIIDNRYDRYPAGTWLESTLLVPDDDSVVTIRIYRFKVLTVDTTNNLMEVEVLNELNNPGITYRYPTTSTPKIYNAYLKIAKLALNITNRAINNEVKLDSKVDLTAKGSQQVNLPLTRTVPVCNNTSTVLFKVPSQDVAGQSSRVRLKGTADSTGQTSGDAPTWLTAQPQNLSVTESGDVTWNNAGLAKHDFYAVHFVVETWAHNDEWPLRSTEVLCILRIQPAANNNAPTLTISPAGPINVTPGTEVTFTVTATAGDTGQQVYLYSQENQAYDPRGAIYPEGSVTMLGNFHIPLPGGNNMPHNAWPVSAPTSISRTIKFTPTEDQDGSYLFAFSATDAEGATLYKTVTVNVSQSGTHTKPSLSFTSPVACLLGNTINIPITVTDPDSGQTIALKMRDDWPDRAGSETFTPATALTSGQSRTMTWTPTGTAENGHFYFHFEATDSTGRVNYKTLDVYVGQDPILDIVSPANGAVFTGTTPPNVSVTTSVLSPIPVQSVTLMVNGADHSTDSSSPYTFQINSMAKGIHTLKLRANYSGGGTAFSPEHTIIVQPKYTLTEIPTHGGFYSTAYSINASGQVTGYANENYYPPTGSQVLHALRWSSGTGLQNLLDPWGSTSYGYPHKTLGWAINDSGIVVGEAVHYTYNTQTAFKWNNGYTLLGSLSGGSAVASAINGNSVIVGTSTTLVSGQYVPRATKWNSGSTTANNLQSLVAGSATAHSFAYSINTAGKIVGKSHSPDGPFRAYLMPETAISIQPFHELGTISFNPTHSSEAWDVNDSNEVVGGSHMNTGEFHAFYRPANGSMIDLGTFGGTFSLAYAINSTGQIVGQARNAQGSTRAFLYVKNSGVMQDLTALVPNTYWTLVSAEDINNDGKIVGWGYNQYGESRGFVLTPNF